MNDPENILQKVQVIYTLLIPLSWCKASMIAAYTSHNEHYFHLFYIFIFIFKISNWILELV